MKDHLDKPVSQVPVVLAEQQSFKQGMDGEDFEGPNRATSDSNGIAVFICNTPAEVTKVVLKVRVWTYGPCFHLCLSFLFSCHKPYLYLRLCCSNFVTFGLPVGSL